MLCELMLQGLEAQTLGLGGFIAEPTALIGLIFVVAAWGLWYLLHTRYQKKEAKP